ncbi:hypothetical protein DAI22_02g132900 [Oryza sativa Japonica Group]|nr:hypothetical protein DAI22_02g132900 [Oryza sativa Japonica Group]
MDMRGSSVDMTTSWGHELTQRVAPKQWFCNSQTRAEAIMIFAGAARHRRAMVPKATACLRREGLTTVVRRAWPKTPDHS